MWTGAGVATIVGASALGLVTVFVLWRRMPAAAAYVLMASCGVGVAVGGLLVQDDVGTAWSRPCTRGSCSDRPGEPTWLPRGLPPRRKSQNP